MKKITILIISLLVFKTTYAQKVNDLNTSQQNKEYSENDSIPKIIMPPKWEIEKPIVVLNNKYVASEVLNTLNPDKIESVKIDKHKIKIDGIEYNGKIIVKTKPKYDLSLIQINDFVTKYTDIKDGICIFSIDGEIQNIDESLMLIDEKNITQIKVTKLNKIENSKDLYLVSLLTRTKENSKKENTFHIRGNELSMNK